MKAKKMRTMANQNLGLKEYVHALLGKEDLGNMEPHARRGRQLFWPQQVMAPGMQVKEDNEHLTMCERKKAERVDVAAEQHRRVDVASE